MSSTAVITTEGHRIIAILNNVQSRIEQLLPNSKDFLKYRDEILKNDNRHEIKVLIDTEAKLKSKKGCLERRIDEIKHNEKKKDFVDARAKLYITGNKLKEVTRQLNRIFCDTGSVIENEAKLQTLFGWIKQKLERDEIEAILLGQKDTILSGIATKDNEVMMKKYSSLQSEISLVRKGFDEIMLEEKSLESLLQKLQEVETHLDLYRQGQGRPDRVLSSNMAELKECRLREFAQKKMQLREEIKNIANEIEKEKLTQIDEKSYYSKQMSILTKELDKYTKQWTKKIEDVDKEIEDATKKRDDNLKILVERRLTVQQREKKIDLERQEKERLEAERDEKEREHQAATILQNKVKVMYLSKLKKKASKPKPGGKKKGKKKK